MSAMEYEMTNDITLPGRKPYKLAGQLNRNPRDFRLGAQIGKNYAVAFTSQYKPVPWNLLIEIGLSTFTKTAILVDLPHEKSILFEYSLLLDERS
jgi:hypothetical protein